MIGRGIIIIPIVLFIRWLILGLGDGTARFRII
jgi:hypothetical protein